MNTALPALGIPAPRAATGSDLSWMDFGLCQETAPEAFFVGKGESTAPAKAVCRRCEVQAECLEYALANRVQHGIWGGTSEMERRALRRQRRRETGE